ncbi:MAG: HemK2/MTQ2 family protein methyltransferase [Candidatus Aenigmatarchaeota archaeon]
MNKYYYTLDGEMLTFEIPSFVYFPAEDSEMMAKIVFQQDIAGKKVLDIGCGSGLLAIISAKCGGSVVSADINIDAVKAAERNAKTNNVELVTKHSSLFEKIDGVFDLIIFNPPYLPENEEDMFSEDKLIYSGGPTGRDIIERFVEQAKSHLDRNGKILMLISTLTQEKSVMDHFHKHGFTTKILDRMKIAWEELIVVEARPRS